MNGLPSRRAFLGLSAAAVACAAIAAGVSDRAAHPAPVARASPQPVRKGPRRARLVPENSRPGDPDWEIRHLGAPDAIEGYGGAASVLTGESFPLFVSAASTGFRVTAFRLGWYGGDGARLLWRSGPLRGHRQHAASVAAATNTVRADWDCQGVSSFGDSAYYTHPAGAGVFNAGTMRWVEAIFGDRPHGITASTSAFVRQVTANVFRAFADGPAAVSYPARDNLDAMHEYVGDLIGSPGNLQ
jgi:hypothetical protein